MSAARPTIGLFGINQGASAEPDQLGRLGAFAEELGYDSLWCGEHVVLPSPRVPPSPMEPDDPILDPLVALASLAASTDRIRLATGIVILPQRNPVVLAKQVASLDVLSGGRLTLGVAAGYVEPEMTAIGVPMSGRGARTEEYVLAMRALWESDTPEFSGEHISFSGVDAHPRPVQRPLPVAMGGGSAAAHGRAARLAQGWYGFFHDLDGTIEQLEGLRAALAEAERPARDLEVSVTPRGRVDARAVASFADAGVDRLVLILPGAFAAGGGAPVGVEEIESFIRAHAPEELGATPAP